jgi:TetR/AcrR family transcriptional regulator, mexJK operon transcriptional repressor
MIDIGTLTRPLGRPVDPAKGDAIIAAARDAFFEHGYSGTSIEEIARRAGVSKVTVYNRFGDKPTLLAESVRMECETMRAMLHTNVDAPIDLADHLSRFGRAMLAFLARPELVRFENMLGGEMERHPELGELFLEAGPRQMQRGLAAVLADAAARGEIIADDPMGAAELLGGMFKGFGDLERRFSGKPEMDTDKRVDQAVTAFLRAHAPPSS